MQKFQLSNLFEPAGDQSGAIEALTKGIVSDVRDQVLLGTTGSGKTFSVDYIRRPASNI